MSKFFSTRAEQDRAIEILLLKIGSSTSQYPVEFWDEIDGTGHEIDAAVAQDFVDVWFNPTSVDVRVSVVGKSWLMARGLA